MARILKIFSMAVCLASSTSAMNIHSCNDLDGFSEVPGMNGFRVYVDTYSNSILDDTSESQDEQGNYRTYRECLAHATHEARIRLGNRTAVSSSSGDTVFDIALAKVPLKIMNGGPSGGGDGGAQHFAYSGQCAQGCVYTHMPERLIRDIANSPDLFMHEYAHVLHLASYDSEESKAVIAAYANFMDTKIEGLETKYDETYVPGECCFWYSATNEKEFFAVTTQAYFLDDDEQRWDWPRTSSLLESEDSEAYDAVVNYWAIDPDAFAKHLSNCKVPFWQKMDPLVVIICLGAILILFGISVCCCIRYCCKRKRGSSSRKMEVAGGNNML